jgi:hypothetical protein
MILIFSEKGPPPSGWSRESQIGHFLESDESVTLSVREIFESVVKKWSTPT